MVNKRRFLVIGSALLGIGLLAACQSTATPTLPTLTEPGIAVGISDDSCPTVTVEAGQQVSWTNQGRDEHIVRAEAADGQIKFESGPIRPGDSFAITFTDPDTYQYDCSADGSLRGTITVEP